MPRRRRHVVRQDVLTCGERPGEHDLCQYRVVSEEGPERLERTEQVGAGVIGFRQPSEAVPEEPEALEEHLPGQAGLVTEQLVDGRRRRPGLFGDLSGGESPDPVSGLPVHGV